MARAATKTSSKTRLAPEAPKKKLGRPLGSKNKTRTISERKQTTPTTFRKSKSAVSKRATVAKPAPAAAVRMSKAELEAHVVKLERSLARARKQNAALKQNVAEANDRIDAAESHQVAPKPVKPARPAKPAKAVEPEADLSPEPEPVPEPAAEAAPAPKPARGRRKKTPVDTEASEDVEEAETEAHAS